MLPRFALLAALIPAAAHAACEGETYLDCPLPDGRRIEACIGTTDFSYRFGKPGAWDLQLSMPIEEAQVTPWSGMGGAIWSSLGFPNAGYVYEVWTSVEKNDENPAMSGGVNVLKGEELIASLDCAPGTANTPAFALEDAMAARGYCYDLDTQGWRHGAACPAP